MFVPTVQSVLSYGAAAASSVASIGSVARNVSGLLASNQESAASASQGSPKLISFVVESSTAEPIHTMLALYLLQNNEEGIKAGIKDNQFIPTPAASVGAVEIPIPEWMRRGWCGLSQGQLERLKGIVKQALFCHPPGEDEDLLTLYKGSIKGLELLQKGYRRPSFPYVGDPVIQTLPIETLASVITLINQAIQGNGRYPELEPHFIFYRKVRGLWTVDQIKTTLGIVRERLHKLVEDASTASQATGMLTSLQDRAVSVSSYLYSSLMSRTAAAEAPAEASSSNSSASAPLASPVENRLSIPQRSLELSELDKGGLSEIKLKAFRELLLEELTRFITFEDIHKVSGIPRHFSGIDKTTAEPLTTLIQLGLLVDEEKGAKVGFSCCQLVIDEDTVIGWLFRSTEGRHQLSHLEGIIAAAVKWYPPAEEKFKLIYSRARKGIEMLIKTYVSSGQNNDLVTSRLHQLISFIDHPEKCDSEHLNSPINYYVRVKALWSNDNKIDNIEEINKVLKKYTLNPAEIEQLSRSELQAHLNTVLPHLKTNLGYITKGINVKFQEILCDEALKFISFNEIRSDKGAMQALETEAMVRQTLMDIVDAVVRGDQPGVSQSLAASSSVQAAPAGAAAGGPKAVAGPGSGSVPLATSFVSTVPAEKPKDKKSKK